MQAARSSVEAADASLAAARSEAMPVISLNGQWHADVERADAANPVSGFGVVPPNNISRDRDVQLRVTFPLFEGFAHGHKVAEARATAQEAVAALWDAERQMTLQVWTGYQAIRTESSNYSATTELVANAHQSYDAATERYRTGVGTIVDMLNAQAALADADSQHIKAISRWRTARLRLAASLGHLTR